MAKIGKKWIWVLGIVLLILLVGCSGIQTNQDQASEEISVRLPIPVIEAAFTAYYSGLDQGFFLDNGLDVVFNLGGPETNPVKMVASDVDDFGVLGGPDTLLVARSKGIPLVAIGVIHRDSDFPILVTLNESGLTIPTDLDGKKVGFFYGHISTDVIRTLLAKEQVDVEEVNVGFDYSSLIAGKIDAQWAWRTTAGINLPEQGYPINIISPQEYGINTHGITIFTTEEMIEDNPELVRDFLQAMITGVEFSLDHPQEALESILERNQKLDSELESKRLTEFNKRIKRDKPIGYMDQGMFNETYDRLVDLGVITNEFDVNDAFTTRFIDEIYAAS